MTRMTSKKKKQLANVRDAKSNKAKLPRPATVEDFLSTDDEDELQPGPGRRPSRPSQPAIAQNFHKLLETVPVVPKKLEAWLNEHGLHDSETVSMLEEKCSTLSKLLRARGMLKTTSSSSAVAPTGMGALEDFDQFFVYRNGKKLMILSPVEIFKSLSTVSTKKVIGYVRREGASTPLIYSISGYTECLHTHPKLLDTDEWTSEVFRFGVFHGHHFRTDGWDRTHGKVDGAAAASHAEPKLMLFYACHLLTKLSGVVQPISKQVGRLDRLRDFKSAKTAEIFLSRAPCEPCKKFQALVEDITGIKFMIKVTCNVGRISLSRNHYGYEVLPTCADDSDAENAAHQEELRSMLRQIDCLAKENEKLNKQMRELDMPSAEKSDSEDSMREEAAKGHVQVVIPKRRLIEVGVPKLNRSPAANITTKTSKTTNHSLKVSTISEFADLPRTPRKRGYNSEDDEDYQLPGRRSLVNTTLSHTSSTTKRKSSRSRLPSPAKSPQFEGLEDFGFNESDFEEVERVMRRESITSLAKRLKKFKHHS